jgi:hypothetical protein
MNVDRTHDLPAGTRAFPVRTPYFYRQMAVRCWRSSRLFEWVPGSRATYVALAKHCWALFREARELWRYASA